MTKTLINLKNSVKIYLFNIAGLIMARFLCTYFNFLNLPGFWFFIHYDNLFIIVAFNITGFHFTLQTLSDIAMAVHYPHHCCLLKWVIKKVILLNLCFSMNTFYSLHVRDINLLWKFVSCMP